ncbi:hypothetical protein BT69DRAFT_1304491 [Atractiella rhizophila]|nr:hypothetical protein BT69DRAFT_1304491 [Atractiella rhizophila]
MSSTWLQSKEEAAIIDKIVASHDAAQEAMDDEIIEEISNEALKELEQEDSLRADYKKLNIKFSTSTKLFVDVFKSSVQLDHIWELSHKIVNGSSMNTEFRHLVERFTRTLQMHVFQSEMLSSGGTISSSASNEPSCSDKLSMVLQNRAHSNLRSMKQWSPNGKS